MVMLAAQPQAPTLNGEYGLWVEDRNDSLVVHFMTRAAQPGFLTATAAGASLTNATTTERVVHDFAFKRPANAAYVELYYGSRTDSADQHRTTLLLAREPRRVVYRDVDSLYVFGDTHGNFNGVTRTLRGAGLIGTDLKWRGGTRNLVFSGDLMDRGPDVTRLLWFVYGLEQQARAAGGRVHVMLGNHETMIFLHDNRYVSAKEKYLASLYGVPYSKMFDTRLSVLGKWLASKPAVIRIDDVLLAHGGVSTDWLAYTPETFDDTLAKFIDEELFYRWSDPNAVIRIEKDALERRERFFLDPSSVFWYRGYAQLDSLARPLQSVLDRYGAKLHVIGHTPTDIIAQKYDGQLINAHPRIAGSELLLLVRDGNAWRRIRYNEAGVATPVGPAAPAAPRAH